MDGAFHHEICFVTRLKNDLQLIFNNLHSRGIVQYEFNVKNLLKRSNSSGKGDYFLCLKSVGSVLHLTEELLNKLDTLSYISKSAVSQQGYLILFLNRSLMFKNILTNVIKQENKYGTKNLQQSCVVLVYNTEVTEFDSLRISLVADHVISFLTSNGSKVYTNCYKSYSALLGKRLHSHECCNDCIDKLKQLYSKIKHGALSSEFRKQSDDDNLIIIEGIESIKCNRSNKFDIGVSNIKLIKDNRDPLVTLGAYIAHFEMISVPEQKTVIHVCLQNQQCKIVKAALLLEILNISEMDHYFISCQNTQVTGSECMVDSFINFQKKEIENAIIHKYSSNMIQNEMWIKHREVLADTALKFCVLKAGVNVPLRINFCLDHKLQNDGVFVQYNYARLLNLFRNFELKVEQGFYKPLTSLEDANFQLLKLEEEWNLLNFVLSFPQLIEETFILIRRPIFNVNKICIMLVQLCSLFSIYYSKIRILGGQQLHLQQIMHSRLWLLKGVHQVILNSFTMLNIQGLKQM